MTHKQLFIFTFILLFFLTACQSNLYNMNSKTEKKASSELYNIKWTLQQTDGTTHLAYLIFKDKGKVSGFSGCNNLKGRTIISENNISFGQLANTRKRCPKKTMEFESNIVSGLSSISNYKIETETGLKKLYLYNERTEIFVFTHNAN